MRALFLLLAALPILVTGTAITSLNISATSNFVGYLVSSFLDHDPAVHLHLSRGNNPGEYVALNKGKPILRSSVGSRAVRDVFLAGNGARTQWYMIATGMLFFCINLVAIADSPRP
jgi:hypothetical protein